MPVIELTGMNGTVHFVLACHIMYFSATNQGSQNGSVVTFTGGKDFLYVKETPYQIHDLLRKF